MVKSISEYKREKIITLLQDTLDTFEEIAKETGVCVATVHNINMTYRVRDIIKTRCARKLEGKNGKR